MSTKLTKIIADVSLQLNAPVSIGDTVATLTANDNTGTSLVDDDGVALPSGNYCFTIDKENSSKEYYVCALTGTSLSSIKNVSRQGVQTSGFVRAHRAGAKVEITDFTSLLYIQDLISGATDLDASDPLKYDADPTITDDKHLATKKYADDLAIAGSPLATEAVYGIAKLSVAAVSAVDPIVVGTNDGRMLTQDENNACVGTSGTPSSTNKFVTNDDTSATASAGKVVRADGSNKIALGYIDSGTTANKIIALDGSAKLPAVDGINLLNTMGNGMSASDTLIQSADTERSSSSLTYELKKSILIRVSGRYRVKFDLKATLTSNSYGRIYKNSSAIGTERLTNSNSYTTYSEDLLFSAGDTCELWMKAGDPAKPAVASNFRIYGSQISEYTVVTN